MKKLYEKKMEPRDDKHHHLRMRREASRHKWLAENTNKKERDKYPNAVKRFIAFKVHRLHHIAWEKCKAEENQRADVYKAARLQYINQVIKMQKVDPKFVPGRKRKIAQ